MTSVSIPKIQPHLSEARSYLAQLTTALDSPPNNLPNNPSDSRSDLSRISTLSRLKTNLAAAISAYELASNARLPYEVTLMKQTDLLWQCNQCDYYLSNRAVFAISSRKPERQSGSLGLWQIRAAVLATARFKLLTHLRRAMPGANVVSLPWRDILPGLRLWLTR